ncbi:MAG TPA: hypothetical protein VFH29_07945 [Anaerolineales bacterium]|nr:hypothetical protein [Anaerolineales bacterium]
MDPSERARRRSVRVKGFDYSTPGAYFVTIVTQGRAALFGVVREGEMRLSPTGSIADSCWREIPVHFLHVELGSFIVMPNHVHGILILHATTAAIVGARHGVPAVPEQRVPARAHHGAPLPPPAAPGSLGVIVRKYKSSVTRQVIRQFGGPRNVWQRNYYEHILRDEADWDRVRRYIEANPMNWDKDEENPERTGTE